MKLQTKQNVYKKAKKDANVSSTFLAEIGKIRQVTNITRSNLDKPLINVLDINVLVKDKTGVLTYGQFRLVNNHSERRAYIIVVISQKNHRFAKQIQILRALIELSTITLCYFPLLPRMLLQLRISSDKTSSSYTATSQDSA